MFADKSAYILPKGGGFELVSCPHMSAEVGPFQDFFLKNRVFFMHSSACTTDCNIFLCFGLLTNQNFCSQIMIVNMTSSQFFIKSCLLKKSPIYISISRIPFLNILLRMLLIKLSKRYEYNP